MASLGTIVLVAAALLGAPVPQPEPQPEVSLGVGWTVAQVRASLDAAPGPSRPTAAAPDRPNDGDASATGDVTSTVEPEPRTSVAPPRPRVSVRPYARHTDVDARIKEARRARALQVSGALAVQGAMLIYGITRALDNAKEAEMMRDERPRTQWNPVHPR